MKQKYINKYFIIGLAAALIFSLNADDLDRSIKSETLPNGDLILLGNDCNELIQQVEAIYLFSGDQVTQIPSCEPSVESRFKNYILIKKTELPKWVSENQNKTFYYNGPNCFNLALVHMGVTSSYHFSSQWEMMHWLDSDRCEEVSDKSLQSGDVGVVFHENRGPYGIRHAFVWVSD